MSQRGRASQEKLVGKAASVQVPEDVTLFSITALRSGPQPRRPRRASERLTPVKARKGIAAPSVVRILLLLDAIGGDHGQGQETHPRVLAWPTRSPFAPPHRKGPARPPPEGSDGCQGGCTPPYTLSSVMLSSSRPGSPSHQRLHVLAYVAWKTCAVLSSPRSPYVGARGLRVTHGLAHMYPCPTAPSSSGVMTIPSTIFSTRRASARERIGRRGRQGASLAGTPAQVRVEVHRYRGPAPRRGRMGEDQRLQGALSLGGLTLLCPG